MKMLSFLSALLFCASTAYSMDLAEMQALALQNREVIKKYVTSLEQGEQDVIRAQGGYYPAVDFGYTINRLDEDSSLENKENSVVVGRVSWNLFSGFKDRYGVQAAQLLQQVDEYRLRGVEQDVQLNVALAYLQVYERRANRDVAESAFQTLAKVYRDGESRYQVGLIGKNELLKFRVDYDNADITLKAADAGLKKSVNSLSRAVGAAITLEDLDFQDFASLPPPIELQKYREAMLSGRSEIKALEVLIEATTAQQRGAESGYYPRLDAVGSYRNYDNDFINGSGTVDEDELRGQLVFSVNLFQGYTTDAAVRKAKLATREAGYDLDELRNSLLTELHNLNIDFQVSLENIEVANRSIEQAEENLRITQLKYDEGLQRESDLLDAITSLSRSKYNYVAVLRTAFLNNFQITRMIDGF